MTRKKTPATTTSPLPSLRERFQKIRKTHSPGVEDLSLWGNDEGKWAKEFLQIAQLAIHDTVTSEDHDYANYICLTTEFRTSTSFSESTRHKLHQLLDYLETADVSFLHMLRIAVTFSAHADELLRKNHAAALKAEELTKKIDELECELSRSREHNNHLEETTSEVEQAISCIFDTYGALSNQPIHLRLTMHHVDVHAGPIGPITSHAAGHIMALDRFSPPVRQLISLYRQMKTTFGGTLPKPKTK